ncbi:cellulose synthase complex periplasmic endoglucanase BcsZ [Entomohabitans teleogrylli]|uniref:cellulose synthase complex periplasmic endoglucanase BcsZ n=1 Tax=Entomohabitans teleogrylli TaxID=1384589 RepID=UPI00073D230F|nr:cellulose synthase complex periplasmic endoglucanase BcsZ [Entomohabitans teleogrylli]
MNWRGATAVLAMLITVGVRADCGWPAWEQFKSGFVSEGGRVVDPSDDRKITTSEGQSYGLFFALVANDRAAFDRILAWTQNNLAKGDLSKQLPAWLWGRREDNQWTVLDTNSASDSDLWIAWALLEAGRLWEQDSYSTLGEQLLARIAKEEVAQIPGLGPMLLPGKVGFAQKDSWRLNPSYLPLQLIDRAARYPGPWSKMRGPTLRLLLETSPKGFSPDWVNWNKGKGWQMKAQPALVSSYNAIRVYLWAGMMSDRDPDKARLLNHFQPMIDATVKRGAPPEQAAVVSGALTNDGPVGFSAALLPALQDSPALYVQRQRVKDQYPQQDAYYNFVLTLYGQGWDQQRFRFTSQGELVPDWGQLCATQSQ